MQHTFQRVSRVIRFNLRCVNEHEFEGWFSSSVDFDQQIASGFLTCPMCNSSDITKSLMTPSVSTARSKEASRVLIQDEAQKLVRDKVKDVIATIKANSEDVGERFTEEARKIHYGEAEKRGIIGQATLQETKDLIAEGIDVAPLPILPDDAN